MSGAKAPTAWKIEQVMTAYASAKQRLLEQDSELQRDEAALARYLAPEIEDVRALLGRLLRAAHHARRMAGDAHEQIEDLRGRQERFRNRFDILRSTVLSIMDAHGVRSLEFGDISASPRAGGASVLVTDETKLADRFVRIKREPNKSEILTALQDGEVVDGAVLRNGAPSLQIRSK